MVELHELLSKLETGMGFTANICRGCNASGVPLKACAGCHTAFYCSPDCQRADWKTHKKICRQAQAAEQDSGVDMQTVKSLAYQVFQDNLFDVRRAIGRLLATDVSLHLSDVAIVMEVGTSRGSSSQQRQPFELYLVSEWEARHNIPPEWFYPGTEVYESNLTNFLMALQNLRATMTENMFLVIAMHNDSPTMLRLSMSHPTADLELSEADLRQTANMPDLEYAMRFRAIQRRCGS